MCERDVFEDTLADGTVSSDCKVGIAFDQDELTVGGGEAACWVVDLLWWVDGGEFREDQGHDGVLPEAGDDLPWGVGEQSCLVLLGLSEGA